MNRFIDGRETTEDDKHTGRQVSVTNDRKVAEMQDYILEDRRVTVENVAVQFGISHVTAQDIISNKLWVPRLLLPNQMGVRVKRCLEYYQLYNDEDDAFLNRVITCDATWIHFFEPKSKQQSSIWKHPSSPSPTKALISKSAGKVMAIFWRHTRYNLKILCSSKNYCYWKI